MLTKIYIREQQCTLSTAIINSIIAIKIIIIQWKLFDKNRYKRWHYTVDSWSSVQKKQEMSSFHALQSALLIIIWSHNVYETEK